jgi:tetratricopeptide (TPR) repeat protein
MDWIVKNIIANRKFDNIFYGLLTAIFIIAFGLDILYDIDILKLKGNTILLALILIKLLAYRITRKIFNDNIKTLSEIPGLLNENKYIETLNKLKSVRLYQNHLTDKKYYRGVAFLNLKESNKALQDFNEIENEYIGDVRFCYNKGLSLFDIGNCKEALKYLTYSIELEKTCKNLDQRGVVLMSLNDLEAAETDLRESIELEINSANSSNYGVYLSRTEDYEQALAYYDKSIKLDNSKAHVFYNRAMTHHKLNNWDLAIHDYTKAQEMGHLNNDIYLNLGYCKCQIGDIANGLIDLKKAKEMKCKEADNLIKEFEDR